MSDWTSGYVADIEYTCGYYHELNPLRLKLAFLNAGLVVPEMVNACELGFGQGLSINMHAAATMINWSGTDFMPSHAGFAQELERVSESGARLYDEGFDQFCSRNDLPEFDYIGLHGIWSWVSEENRTIIVDFIRRKLKVGGVLYVSYNIKPGWAAMIPMRDLLLEHKKIMGYKGEGVAANLQQALMFADQLMKTSPQYAQANPYIYEWLSKMKAEDRNYLTHEYFNENWAPFHFYEINKILSDAKMTYACSAHYLDHVDSINISSIQKEFLEKISDSTFRQTVKDFMVNQTFRRDYWVKGARLLSALERIEMLRDEKVILSMAISDINLNINTNIGEVALTDKVYLHILEMMANYQPKTLWQIERQLIEKYDYKEINFGKILQAVLILSGIGALMPVQPDEIIRKVKTRTDKLNLKLMNKARSSSELIYLTSPVTGGGIAVDRLEQMFLLAKIQGYETTTDWAQYAWKVLASQGQRLSKEGRELESEEENLLELNQAAQVFSNNRIPLLKGLQINCF